MSEENVELVRDAIEAWQGSDEAFEASVRRYYAADATWEPFSDFPEPTTRRGRDKVLRGLLEVRHAAETSELRAEKLVAAGDRVVAAMVVRAAIRGTRDELAMEYGNVFTVQEGKITDVHSFRTFEEALEAAGLRE